MSSEQDIPIVPVDQEIEAPMETQNLCETSPQTMNSKDGIAIETSHEETANESMEKNENDGVQPSEIKEGKSISTETPSDQEALNDSHIQQSSANSESTSESSIQEGKGGIIVHSVTHIANSFRDLRTVNNSDSLQHIQKYNSDSSDSSDDSDSSEDSEEDSDTSEDSSDSDHIEEEVKKEWNKKEKKKLEGDSWLTVLGVSESIELPDISNLNLNDEEQFIHMGNLDSIIDTIVTVAGLPQLPAYDLDSLLFLEEGRKILGHVLDVMGLVTEPVYIIQMSSVEAIKDLGLQKGIKVYCAPRSQYTKYVLIQDLMRIRGSDASGEGDTEVPIELQEFSDDEEERSSKSKKDKRKRSPDRDQPPSMDRLPQGAPGKYSTPNRNRTPHRQHPVRIDRPNFHYSPQVPSFPSRPVWNVANPVPVGSINLQPRVAPFNPSVPPPGFGMPAFFPPPRSPFNLPPRGTPFNSDHGRPVYRPNLPGPSDGNWFNRR